MLIKLMVCYSCMKSRLLLVSVAVALIVIVYSVVTHSQDEIVLENNVSERIEAHQAD